VLLERWSDILRHRFLWRSSSNQHRIRTECCGGGRCANC